MKALAGLLTVLIVLCSPLSAQDTGAGGFYASLDLNSYSYFGGSARSMAMGYAFVGLANDASSGVWNPAGLWTLERPIVAGSYNIYVPGGSFTQNLTPGVTDNDLDKDALGHFSFVAPVRIKGHPFVFNFNFDRTNEYTSKGSFDGIVDSGSLAYYQEDIGHVQMYNFGGCTRIYKQLSAGALVNIFDGRRAAETRSVYDVNVIVDPLFGTTQNQVMTLRVLDSITSTGFNFTGGLMLKSDKYSIGAVVHTPFTMKHSDDNAALLETALDGLPNSLLSDTVYLLDNMTKQDLPLTLAAGVGVFPTENLTLTLDLNYQNYGSTKWYYRTGYFIDAGGERTDYYSSVPIGWNNTFGIGSGVEYMVDIGIGQIPLRAGLRYDQLPQPKDFSIYATDVGYDLANDPYQLDEAFVTRTSSGRQSETSFSLGSGIAWSQVRFDFAYRFTTGRQLNETVQTVAYDESQPGNVLDITSKYVWERKANEFRVTMTGYF
jgi:long-subunit fatty acid transport protein